MGCAGQKPDDAGLYEIQSSDGLRPWPVPGGACLQAQEAEVIKQNLRGRNRRKGGPCWEGQAVAVPKLQLGMGATKACLVFVRRAHTSNDAVPGQADLMEQGKAALTAVLLGSERVPGSIDSCAPIKVVEELPIDLSALAVCFAKSELIKGVAVVPVLAAIDPLSPVHNWHVAEVGFDSPSGGVVIELFLMPVRHPGALRVEALFLKVIAMPAM